MVEVLWSAFAVTDRPLATIALLTRFGTLTKSGLFTRSVDDEASALLGCEAISSRRDRQL